MRQESIAAILEKALKKLLHNPLLHRSFYHFAESNVNDYTLISTSTPQGNSSFIRASTVLEVVL